MVALSQEISQPLISSSISMWPPDSSCLVELSKHFLIPSTTLSYDFIPFRVTYWRDSESVWRFLYHWYFLVPQKTWRPPQDSCYRCKKRTEHLVLPKPPIKEIHFYGYIPLFVGLYVTSISIMMVGLLHWNLCAPPKTTGDELVWRSPHHWYWLSRSIGQT